MKIALVICILVSIVFFQNCGGLEAFKSKNITSQNSENFTPKEPVPADEIPTRLKTDYDVFCEAEENMKQEDIDRKLKTKNGYLKKEKLYENSQGELNNDIETEVILTQEPRGQTGWKAGSYSLFETHGNTAEKHLAISDFVARKGPQSFKFNVPDEQSPEILWYSDKTHRVEVSGPLLRETSSRWYRMSLLYPAAVKELRAGYVYQIILAQIWQNTLPCGGHTSPPFTLNLARTEDGNMGLFAGAQGSNLPSYHYDVSSNEYKDHETYESHSWKLLETLPKGEWIDLFFKVTFSKEGRGEVEVKYKLPKSQPELQTLLSVKNIRVGHNCDCGAFYKVGAYVGKWNVKPKTSYHYQFYMDAIEWAPKLEDFLD